MSVPSKRRAASKTKKGRSHQALKAKKTIKCSKCGKAKLPHQVCSFCGSYRGREVVKPKTKKKK